MRDAAAFLRLIAAAPDDDGPRLLYADWLEERGDPRGAFLRVQCALARLPADHPRRADLEQAERHLLAEHGAAWAHPLAGRVSGYHFRRGFVEEITLAARTFLEHAPALLAAGPLRTVRLHDASDHVERLAACPHLARLARLDLCGNRLGDDGVTVLARSPSVRSLRALGLSFNGLTDGGVQALVAAGPWPRLRALDLSGNDRLTGRGATALARATTLPHLIGLDLSDNQLDGTAVWALAHSKALGRLAELGLAGNPLGDTGARILAESPLLPRLAARTRALELPRTGLGPDGLRALAASGHLAAVRVLRLDRNHVGDSGLAALTRAQLPRLRELHLAANGVGDRGAAALAGSRLLTRLALVDLSDNGLSPAAFVTLMGSPFRHWRTVFELHRNNPPDPDPYAPISFDDEEDE